jgi:hypothetical protein
MVPTATELGLLTRGAPAVRGREVLVTSSIMADIGLLGPHLPKLGS